MIVIPHLMRHPFGVSMEYELQMTEECGTVAPTVINGYLLSMPLIARKEVPRKSKRYDGAVEEVAAA